MNAAADDWVPPESWLVVLETSESSTHIDPADEGTLDAAVTRYLDSGCTRDELLCLTLSEGGNYRVRVSLIAGWWLNTPEHCMRNLLRNEASKNAERERRATLGLTWKEEDE